MGIDWLFALEWAGSGGIILSILLYPRTVWWAATLALLCNTSLIYLFMVKEMWGVVLLCCAASLSHLYNLWRENKNA